MESVDDKYRIYEVKPGDSLSAIAAHFGFVTPTQLARLNRLSLVGCGLPPVFPGQKLVIPMVPKIAPGLRRAPGAAFRVKPTVPPATFVSLSSKHEATVDPTERQFVKVRAKRVLIPSGKLIDGVLLVTPDSLFFDASITASAQDEFYLSLHVDPKSIGGDVEEGSHPRGDVVQDSSTLSSPHLPKDLLDLGLCLPLVKLTSMSTMKTLSRRNTLCSRNSDPISDEQKDVRPCKSPFDVEAPEISHAKLVGSYLDHPEHSTLHSEASSLAEGEPLARSSSGPCSSDLPGTVESEVQNICLLEPKGSLFLKLTQRTDSASALVEHYFLISVDYITELLSFLLRVGVGSTGEQSTTVNQFGEAVAATHRMGSPSPSDQSGTAVRRTLVEEALESLECSTNLPSLHGETSGLLTNDKLVDLGSNFPTHWIGCNLKLVYMAEKDGYSLHTVYRKCRDVEGGVLMVIRDTMGTVFGSIMPEKIYCSNRFYGTGETCVFHWSPDFKRYDWTKKNYFFMHGTATSFQIGGQSGRNAIWIDEALKYGRSEPTDTFDNPVLSGVLRSLKLDTSLLAQDRTANPCNSDLGSSGSLAYSSASPAPDSVNSGLDSVPFIIDSLEVWELVN